MEEERNIPEEEIAEEQAATKAEETPATPANDLQVQLEQLQDQYQRVLAEYANYKRRTDQEKEQLGSFVKGEVLKALLPTLDDLERAIAAPEGEEYRTGVEMVLRELQKTLSTMGLTEISALGEVFDPERHHAVMREDADGVEPETVTEVYQKGYQLGTRVLRSAMVKVAN